MPVNGARTNGTNGATRPHHTRRHTHPLSFSTRKKPRRWPLVLRFIKGAIHLSIVLPVLLHTLWTALIVCLDKYVDNLGIPATVIPSLSIVVGLMLVFRNQTSYNRFWDGRMLLTTVNTSIRNVTRTVLTNSLHPDHPLTPAEKADIDRSIRILMSIPYAVKHHLRAEWGSAWAPTEPRKRWGSFSYQDDETGATQPTGFPNTLSSGRYTSDYENLLPAGMHSFEDQGLGLPYQLTYFVDAFVKRGVVRGWYHAPGASQLQVQLNNMVDSYGKMETIRMTPIPVAILIHQRQVLALFCCVLPFAIVDDMGWFSIPLIALLAFTLYGIEGIASQLEDPFGYDRNDIKMDAIADDCRTEVSVCLAEWRRVCGWNIKDGFGNGIGAVDINGEPTLESVAGTSRPTVVVDETSLAADVGSGRAGVGLRGRMGQWIGGGSTSAAAGQAENTSASAAAEDSTAKTTGADTDGQAEFHAREMFMVDA